MLPRTWLFWLEAAIVGAWVALMVHSQVRMTDRSPVDHDALAMLETVTDGPGTEWMSVYLEGKKIGCGFSDKMKQLDGYRFQERMYLRLRAFQQTREITTTLVAETDRKRRLKHFDFMLSATPSVIHVAGTVRGKILDLEIETGGEVRTQQVRLEEPPELSVTFKDRLVSLSPSVGDVLELPYFDPATLSRQTLEVKVVGEGTAVVNGERVRTLKLEASYQGLKTTAVVTEDGLTLEETNALGMTLRREPREEAINGGWGEGEAPVDIVALSAVPLDRPLRQARSIRYLHARLSGAGVKVLLGKLYPGDQPGEVEVRVVDRSRWRTYQIPMVDPRFSGALSDTPLVQKNDPKIVRVAQSIIGDVTDAEEAAALLNGWVHEKLRKEPVMGVPSALEILESLKGDCNEHTTLFTALARAVGIPTRMAAGVVYSDEAGGGVPGFYYHAWPEVYLGTWVAIDPTFGQFPADATHIKLVEGELEEQLALVRVVGNLRIQVLEYH